MKGMSGGQTPATTGIELQIKKISFFCAYMNVSNLISINH